MFFIQHVTIITSLSNQASRVPKIEKGKGKIEKRKGRCVQKARGHRRGRREKPVDEAK